jgi:hypothetical protein
MENGAPDVKATGTQIIGKFALEERRDGSQHRRQLPLPTETKIKVRF